MHAGIVSDCPWRSVTNADAPKVSKKTGSWALTQAYIYYLDKGLVFALARFFLRNGGSLVEFGAGKGCYSEGLRAAGVRTVRAYDGAPNVAVVTNATVRHADLTEANLQLGMSDWVLCTEVAEHIPRPLEDAFVTNVIGHARVGVVISWSPTALGNGHVNPRNRSYVEHLFRRRGLHEDRMASSQLNSAVSDMMWLKDNVLVFRRRAAHIV